MSLKPDRKTPVVSVRDFADSDLPSSETHIEPLGSSFFR
jgi:hypothetical protein